MPHKNTMVDGQDYRNRKRIRRNIQPAFIGLTFKNA
jgi:hypothetical protein